MRFATVVLFALASLLPRGANAATINVDTTSTAESLPDACTLRAAVRAAAFFVAVGGCPAGDVQVTDVGGNVNTVVLPEGAVFTFTDSSAFGSSSALPNIGVLGPLVISGRGATIERSDQFPACDPMGPDTPDKFRLMNLTGDGAAALVTLRDLTLRNGCTVQGGGAINANQTAVSLHLDNVRIVGSRAGDGGALLFRSVGDLDVQRSYFLQNTSPANLAVNVAALGAGNTVRFRASTFAGNVGGLQMFRVGAGHIELRDSTFSENFTTLTSDPGAGTLVALLGDGQRKVLHNTFSGNITSRATAPSLAIVASNAAATSVQFQGNWLADESAAPNCQVTAGTISVTGANLSTDASCPSFALVAPGQMRPLGWYGGLVPTTPPLPNSMAIDVSTSCNDPVTGQLLGTDARGVPRPQDGDSIPGAQCDAGAAEFVRNQAPVIALPNPLTTLAGQSVPVQPQVVVSDPDSRLMPIRLRLEPDDGVLDFDASLLDCTTGDGVADPVAVCLGTVAELNDTLATLAYRPRAGFIGSDSLRVEVDDLGAGGDDQVPRGDAADLAINVLAATVAIASITGPVDFGNVEVGATVHRNLVITNTGNATLQALVLSLPPQGSGFVVTGSCGPIEPGASCTLDAAFTPPAVGAASYVLSVASNATNSPTVVSLQGNGVPNATMIFADGFE